MKTKILELIDKSVKKFDRTYKDCESYSEHGKGYHTGYKNALQELRQEIEEMEDETIKTIDNMIKVLEYNKKVTESNTIFLQLEAQEYILKELKSRLYPLTQK